MKNLSLAQASSSEREKLSKLKMIKESHADDLLVIQQQQAIFNDATSFSNLTHDLRQLSSDASRNRNRSSGHRADNQESCKGSESTGKSSGKPKHSSSAIVNLSTQNEARSITTTSLAISFSSPNLATNTSFSSSSDSSEFDLACGVSSIVKVQNLLDDNCSIDDNDPADHESLNLAGENDVEYAELTQRMIPPSQKAQQMMETVAMDESDLNLLHLFDASGSPRSTEAESSSCNSSSSGSSSTSLRPASSVLPINNLFESPGASSELASFNAYANNFNLPSGLNQEAAHSLPPEISCTSPVWKPVWRFRFFLFIFFYYFVFFYDLMCLMVVQTYRKHLNDFMQNVKLLNNDVNNDMIPSTSSNKRHQRSTSHKRMSFNDNNENSIDADIDLALFPSDMDNMKKYTDDIWRKTLSSDCDPSSQVWEKQRETNKTPAIVWPSTSSHGLFGAPKNHFFSEDIWSNVPGGNIFFPASAPSISALSNAKKLSEDVKHRKKNPGNKSLMVPATSSLDIDDDFNHMKKRLSLSSLRTSLCRQRAVENLNNGNAAHAFSSSALDADNDFLEVDFVTFIS